MIAGIARDEFTRQLRGFLLGSVLNFAISYCCYASLSQLLHYQLAYFIAYVVGIAWSYWFNATHVFKVHKTLRTFCIYPTVYALQYAAAYLVLWYLVERIGLHSLAAPVLTAAITFPLTFLLSKLVLENNLLMKRAHRKGQPYTVNKDWPHE